MSHSAPPATASPGRKRTGSTPDPREILTFASSGEWQTWLEQHHDRRREAWLRIAKKGADLVTVSIFEALDGALCFGWIDGQRRVFDEASYLQRYSPRRPKGDWSQVNVRKVEGLIAAGRMRPAGMAAVDAARADGRWAAAYPAQRDATVPDDLAQALERDAAAQRTFASLGRTDRYAAILHLAKARSTATRQRRLQALLGRLSSG
jgi:uncharacterized protein YdeI (YjbR/CyaY-like superfamily)